MKTPSKSKYKPALTREKWAKALEYCYCQLYKNSTPPADFLELPYKDPESNFFMDYEIDEKVYMDLVRKAMLFHHVPNRQRPAFINTVHLGPSPKFKKNGEK